MNVFTELNAEAGQGVVSAPFFYRGQLVEGNSKLSASDSLAEIAGPPAGGLLVQLISAPLALIFDALSFLISALAIWRIGAREPAPAAPQGRPSLHSDLAEGQRA